MEKVVKGTRDKVRGTMFDDCRLSPDWREEKMAMDSSG